MVTTGPDFALATLEADLARAHRIIGGPTRFVPRPALRLLDATSRKWLVKWDNDYLPEIDAIAARLDRPGVHFLSVMYEWACTCAARPSPDGTSARLVRVLDWATPGLGREVMAARIEGPAGLYVAMTWPGFSGVIQAMAPGRFSAALNQAPLQVTAGLSPIDWVMARRRLWQTPHPTAAHVLRRAFERCGSYAEAKAYLTSAPIALPAIYTLAGLTPDETCVIERAETAARVVEGPAIAANHWQPDAPSISVHGARYAWRGHARSGDSHGRAGLMPALDADLTADFSWARYPVLNGKTRLLMVADAKAGRLVAVGIEGQAMATRPLDLVA